MIPFEVTDWDKIPAKEHKGETGIATWRTMQYQGLRVRSITYSQGYVADHWCDKGHIVFCVDGEFTSHMKDGSLYILSKGMSYQTTDDKKNPHLSTSKTGCKLFIVDGDFLKTD